MTKKLVLVIGGTGAQGIPVVKSLTSDSKYSVRVITRNASSAEALELASISGVSIFEGDCYDEPTLRKAFLGVDCAFVNTNGLAIGEKAETFWGIRMYEIAYEFGVKHFLYAGLEYASKLGGFKEKYRTGHLDGKAKVADYLSAQPTNTMAWSVLTSCMYMESLSEFLLPQPDPNDPEIYVFAVPLGDAKCPLIYLKDYGDYVRWMFDNATKSTGLNLHVGTEDIAWKDLAAAFTAVTGKTAVYKELTMDEFFNQGIFPNPEAKVGHSVSQDDPTLVTVRQSYSGFFNMWRDGLTKRDYKLLDEILPGRVKSVKEWMELTGYTGQRASVLKDYRHKTRG